MEIMKNKAGFEFVILENKGRVCVIKFLESNSIREAHTANVYAGKVKDYYAKTRLGVGYIGEFKKESYHKEALQLWSNMMKRCYNPKDEKGYYHKGTTVDARWLCYANFLEDLPKLKGFDKWLNKENVNLDKDLIEPDCNVYSVHTCQFISEFENKSQGKKGKKLVDGKWLTPTY
jgi:hypothetical protein